MLEYLFFIFPQSWPTFIVSAKKKERKENRRMNFSFSCKYWVIFSYQTSDLCIFPEFKSPCLLPRITLWIYLTP